MISHIEEEGVIQKFSIKKKYYQLIKIYFALIIIILYLLFYLIIFNLKINKIIKISLLNQDNISQVKENIFIYNKNIQTYLKTKDIIQLNNIINDDNNDLNNSYINSSKYYWEKRYAKGGNSGPGSYKHLAQFKASVINNFVNMNNISTVIEWGCGDCNQLSLANYKNYIGYDVSRTAINICKKRFYNDSTKKFYYLSDNFINNKKADLSISLDVIFHLIEDDVFDLYMQNLFNSSNKYIIIYSSNFDGKKIQNDKYVMHRVFTNWIKRYMSKDWRLKQYIPNKYPVISKYSGSVSYCNFYIYEKYNN